MNPGEVGAEDRTANSATNGIRRRHLRPAVVRILDELERENAELQAEVDRATAEWNRPRGLMGKLFGLRTHVG